MKKVSSFLCAVGFDDRTRSVVQAAAKLAKGAGVGMDLVHVAEPWDQYGIAHFLKHDTRASTLVRDADAETFQRAESLLVQLAESLAPDDIPIRTRVLKGHAGELLVREAAATNAWVVTGFKKNPSNFYPKNMSTTLTLATESKTPVLFVPQDGERQLERSAINILASDDLTPESLETIHTACQLAQWYAEADVWHVHVSSLTEETLNGSIAKAFAEAHTSLEPGLAGRELFALMAEAMQRKLIQRLGDDGQCGARRHSVLRFGDLENELSMLRGEHAINVAVFGKHRPFHTEPFYVGNLPPATMFKLDMPVLIAPA